MYESHPDEWYDLVFTRSRMFIEGPEEHVQKALAKFKNMQNRSWGFGPGPWTEEEIVQMQKGNKPIPQADGDSREEGV